MSLIADRVFETTTSSGTGAITLAGAVPEFRAFADAFTNGDRVLYAITQDGVGWEVGIGTLGVGPPDTIARATADVLSSSNAGLLVNFAAGSSVKNVFNGLPGALFAPMVLDPSGKVRFDFDQGDDIASGATTDIWAATGNSVTITGAVAITSFGAGKAGSWRLIRFAGSLTLTHDPVSLILPGGGNIVTAPGDLALVKSEGGSDARVMFFPADGRAVVGTTAASQAQMEAQSATDVMVTPENIKHSPHVAKVWALFNGTGVVSLLASENVSSITDNGVGSYSVNYTTAFSTANYAALATSSLASSRPTYCDVDSHAVGSAVVRVLSDGGSGTTYTGEDVDRISFNAFGDQ